LTAPRHRAPKGRSDAGALRVGIVLSEYHRALAARLLAGAQRCLTEAGVAKSRREVFRVPGSFELPLAAARILEVRPRAFDALVCLGVLIRGETAHFEVLAREVCRGIGETARRAGVPIGFGVLTVENERQARDRTGNDRSNKGWEAAAAALRMAGLYRALAARVPARPGRR
jgi:6,7-dimethyl-8-ribityllumazine synthase